MLGTRPFHEAGPSKSKSSTSLLPRVPWILIDQFFRWSPSRGEKCVPQTRSPTMIVLSHPFGHHSLMHVFNVVLAELVWLAPHEVLWFYWRHWLWLSESALLDVIASMVRNPRSSGLYMAWNLWRAMRAFLDIPNGCQRNVSEILFSLHFFVMS